MPIHTASKPDQRGGPEEIQALLQQIIQESDELHAKMIRTLEEDVLTATDNLLSRMGAGEDQRAKPKAENNTLGCQLNQCSEEGALLKARITVILREVEQMRDAVQSFEGHTDIGEGGMLGTADQVLKLLRSLELAIGQTTGGCQGKLGGIEKAVKVEYGEEHERPEPA